jgi:hypothetical protein
MLVVSGPVRTEEEEKAESEREVIARHLDMHPECPCALMQHSSAAAQLSTSGEASRFSLLTALADACGGGGGVWWGG